MKGIPDEEEVSVEEWQKSYINNKGFKLQAVNLYADDQPGLARRRFQTKEVRSLKILMLYAVV
jgi:hypothetical protein